MRETPPMSNLADRTCASCAGAAASLQSETLARLAGELGGAWQVVGATRLEKEYLFKNFREALAFTNRVGAVAERENHHPDIELGWGRVKLVIWTHRLGGLTEADFVLAAKADREFTGK